MLGKNRPKREQTILLGDMKAKIANCNIGYEEVMDTHGLGDMNNNEERFADIYGKSQTGNWRFSFSTKKSA